jgi:hypothetical protein
MGIEIQLRIIGDDDSVISADEVLHFDKGDDRLKAVGLSLGEGKAVIAGIQERVVTAQAARFLNRHQCCSGYGRALLSKGPGQIQFRTAFGTIPLNSPRFHRCHGEQDLQSAERTFHRAHRTGAALSGNGMGLASLLQLGRRTAERPSADRQHRQCLHHSPPVTMPTSAASSRVALTRATASRSRRRRPSSASMAATSGTGTTKSATSRSWPQGAMTGISAWSGARMTCPIADLTQFCRACRESRP